MTKRAFSRKGGVEARAREIEDAYLGNYTEFQYCFVEFLTEHLCDLSREFKGDIQEVIVLAIIGQAYLHSVALQSNAAKGRTGGFVNATRISDLSHLPRETVRRKLKSLASRGWIEQMPDRSWRLVSNSSHSAAKGDLKDLDARARKRVSKFVATMESLASSRKRP